ncbi:ATP-binding cassette domain-containing protein [Anderseniella sp. Alg231-50]|uniref:ATP-binding cassette domain-containing protein n=1 Tax=Anderseniella sp. Alg231-50 TaxID=1922226 RepID=UPI000D54D19A
MSFISFILSLWKFRPGLLALNVVLLVVRTLAEGLGLILLVPLLALVGVAAQGETSWFTGVLSSAFDRLGLDLSLRSVLLVFVGLMVARAAVGFAYNLAAARLQYSFLHELRASTHRAVTRANWPFLAMQDSGVLNHSLSIQSENAAFGVGALARLASSLFAVAISLATALLIDARLTLIVTALALAMALPILGFDFRAYRLSERSVSLLENLFKRFRHQLDDLKSIKSAAGEEQADKRFDDLSQRYVEAMILRAKNGAQAGLVHDLAAVFMLAALIWLVSSYSQTLSVEPVALIIIFARLFPRAGELQRAVRDLLAMMPGWRRIHDLREAAQAHGENLPAGAMISVPFRDSLVLENVAYVYPNSETQVLQDICIELPAGSATGLVGLSGAGKTTLLDLMSGLLMPTGGRISVDGEVLDDTRRKAWRQTVAYVLQDAQLVNENVRFNVAPFDDDPGDAEIWAALEMAGAAEIVRKLPGGLDTLLGDRGSRLSRGQRQRISLARALYLKPGVLFLDEATSALNPADEAAIVATLQGLRPHTTIVVVAHRLSSLSWTDKLYTLQDGCLSAHVPSQSTAGEKPDLVSGMRS